MVDFNFANIFPSISYNEKDNSIELLQNYKNSKAINIFGKIPSILTEKTRLKDLILSISETHYDLSRFFSLLNFVYYTYFVNENLFYFLTEKIKKRFLGLYGQNLFTDQQFYSLHKYIYGSIIQTITFSVIKEGLETFLSKITFNLTEVENKSLCGNEEYNEQIRKFFYKIKTHAQNTINENTNKILLEKLLESGTQIPEIGQSNFLSFFDIYVLARQNFTQKRFSKSYLFNIKGIVEEKYLETINNIKNSEEIKNLLYNYFLDWGKVNVYINEL